MEFPENLGTGKPHNPNYSREWFKLGLCYRALGELDRARESFRQAAGWTASPGPPTRRPQPFAAEEEECRRRAREELDRMGPKSP